MPLPWRFFIPRSRYFQSLKIAKACPEIRGHIDSIAFYTAAETILAVPVYAGLVLAIPFALIVVAGKKILAFLPDFSARRIATLREAHEIVPIDEIRKRIGLPDNRARILQKGVPVIQAE